MKFKWNKIIKITTVVFKSKVFPFKFNLESIQNLGVLTTPRLFIPIT